MKINLDFQFKNLQGKEYDLLKRDEKGNLTTEIDDNSNAAKSLALTLFHASEKNIKFSIWCQQLYTKGEIDIDIMDLDILIAWIENYIVESGKTINTWFAQNGIKIQVIESLKKQKENQK
jgi:hypothetical protein